MDLETRAFLNKHIATDGSNVGSALAEAMREIREQQRKENSHADDKN